MAYACPVCEEPQVDGEHLANHLAFTAITGDDAHEAWLDETVPEWGQLGQADLAAVVVERAAETEFPVDVGGEDLGGPAHGRHGHGDDGHGDGGRERGGSESDRGVAQSPPAPTAAEDDVEDVLAEARELTRRMQGGDVETENGDGDGATDSDAAVDDAEDAADRSDSETQ